MEFDVFILIENQVIIFVIKNNEPYEKIIMWNQTNKKNAPAPTDITRLIVW